MTDCRSREPDVIVGDMSEHHRNERRGSGQGCKPDQEAEAYSHQLGISSADLSAPNTCCYSASSEYGVVGTWASIAFSSAMIFGLRSQT
jgi:hypothetical protein